MMWRELARPRCLCQTRRRGPGGWKQQTSVISACFSQNGGGSQSRQRSLPTSGSSMRKAGTLQEVSSPSKLNYVNTVKPACGDLLQGVRFLFFLGFAVGTRRPAEKYAASFTAFKSNKSAANLDSQRQECHNPLNSLVNAAHQKRLLSSVLLLGSLSNIFLCFLVLVKSSVLTRKSSFQNLGSIKLGCARGKARRLG